jgi:hypothetical protein
MLAGCGISSRAMSTQKREKERTVVLFMMIPHGARDCEAREYHLAEQFAGSAEGLIFLKLICREKLLSGPRPVSHREREYFPPARISMAAESFVSR